jgi:hypothetical protein
MNRLRITLITVLTLTACSKDKPQPAPAPTPGSAATGKSVTATAMEATQPAGQVAKPADPPLPKQPELPKVTKTGVLDFELAEADGHFVLRDDAYELTFPFKPDVEGGDQVAPSGAKLHIASGLAEKGNDIFGFFIIPVPKNVPYDVDKGLKGARDGALAKINGKLETETATKMDSLKGRKSIATASVGGQSLHVEMVLAFDKDRHTVLGMFTTTGGATATAAGNDFIGSFKVKTGKGPDAGDGT